MTTQSEEALVTVRLVGGPRDGAELQVPESEERIYVNDPDAHPADEKTGWSRQWMYVRGRGDTGLLQSTASFDTVTDARLVALTTAGYDVPAAEDLELLVIRLTPSAPGDGGTLNLRFPAEYAEEVQRLLDDEQVKHSTAAEFSAGVNEWIEALHAVIPAAGGVGGLIGVAKVISAIAHRNDGKSVKFDNDEYITEVTGLSPRQIVDLMDSTRLRQLKIEQRWREMNERMDKERDERARDEDEDLHGEGA